MKYQNPILRGFNADPSICRVGEDYYLVTSTNAYFPGIPVYHSRDLVNWTLISHCVSRPEDYPLNETSFVGGIWAPTIRYHEGTFYVTSTCMGYGNFIVTAKDPAGPWSKPIPVPLEGIDPSIYFEDGKAYYSTNQSATPGCPQGIYMVEIDLQTGQPLGEAKYIWSGTGGGFEEGPHLYHIGDWYYIIMAEGGTFYMHMVTAARSKNIWGPYEPCPHNPILTNRHDDTMSVACSGHAELFDDVNGNWWMVHIATRSSISWNSHLGRETFLTPVIWENGWPKVACKGMALLNEEGPLTAEQNLPKEWTADFSKRELSWINLRLPIEKNYIWQPDSLTLIPDTDKLSDELGRPTFLGQRQFDMESSFRCTMNFETKCDGDEAGVTTYTAYHYFFKICKRRENGQDYIIVEKHVDDIVHEAYRAEVDSGEITFTVDASKKYFDFYYTAGNGNAILADHASTHLLSWDMIPAFTGMVFGVYTCCEVPTTAKAVITNFSMKRN